MDNVRNSAFSDSLEDIIAGCESVADVLELLSMHPGGSQRLQLPPTLVKMNNRRPLLLYTSSDGLVERVSGHKCFTGFLDQVKRLSRRARFVYSEGSTKEFCASSQEAIQRWTVSNSPYKLIQMYILPADRRPSKLRVHWSSLDGMACYLIRKNCQIPNVYRRTIIDKSKEEVYQYNVVDFPHAGQLFKSSFSNNYPYKPGLRRRKPTVRCRLRPKVQAASHDFFVKFSDHDCEFEEIDPDETIENMVKEVAALIKKSISEIIVDFLPSANGAWYLKSCKCYRMDTFLHSTFRHREGILPRFNDISMALRKELSKLPSLNIDDIRDRLLRLRDKSANLRKKHKKVVLENRELLYRSDAIEFRARSVQSSNIFNRFIDEAAVKIDSCRAKARNSKEYFLKNLALSKNKQNNTYQSFVYRVFDKLDEYFEPDECSRKLERSIQYWGYNNIGDLAYMMKYITSTLDLDSYRFQKFAWIVRQVCEDMNMSDEKIKAIQSIISTTQQEINNKDN